MSKLTGIFPSYVTSSRFKNLTWFTPMHSFFLGISKSHELIQHLIALGHNSSFPCNIVVRVEDIDSALVILSWAKHHIKVERYIKTVHAKRKTFLWTRTFGQPVITLVPYSEVMPSNVFYIDTDARYSSRFLTLTFDQIKGLYDSYLHYVNNFNSTPNFVVTYPIFTRGSEFVVLPPDRPSDFYGVIWDAYIKSTARKIILSNNCIIEQLVNWNITDDGVRFIALIAKTINLTVSFSKSTNNIIAKTVEDSMTDRRRIITPRAVWELNIDYTDLTYFSDKNSILPASRRVHCRVIGDLQLLRYFEYRLLRQNVNGGLFFVPESFYIFRGRMVNGFLIVTVNDIMEVLNIKEFDKAAVSKYVNSNIWKRVIFLSHLFIPDLEFTCKAYLPDYSSDGFVPPSIKDIGDGNYIIGERSKAMIEFVDYVSDVCVSKIDQDSTSVSATVWGDKQIDFNLYGLYLLSDLDPSNYGNFAGWSKLVYNRTYLSNDYAFTDILSLQLSVKNKIRDCFITPKGIGKSVALKILKRVYDTIFDSICYIDSDDFGESDEVIDLLGDTLEAKMYEWAFNHEFMTDSLYFSGLAYYRSLHSKLSDIYEKKANAVLLDNPDKHIIVYVHTYDEAEIYRNLGFRIIGIEDAFSGYLGTITRGMQKRKDPFADSVLYKIYRLANHSIAKVRTRVMFDLPYLISFLNDINTPDVTSTFEVIE